MANTSYTIEDLENARAELRRWDDAFADTSSNNPNKYRSQIRAAASEVRRIEAALKDAGVIPLTEHEKLERELDVAFPQAQSKEVVEYRGKKYQRWFSPAEKSNSGKTVHEWKKGWSEVY